MYLLHANSNNELSPEQLTALANNTTDVICIEPMSDLVTTDNIIGKLTGIYVDDGCIRARSFLSSGNTQLSTRRSIVILIDVANLRIVNAFLCKE